MKKEQERRTYLEQIEAFATHFHTFGLHIILPENDSLLPFKRDNPVSLKKKVRERGLSRGVKNALLVEMSLVSARSVRNRNQSELSE